MTSYSSPCGNTKIVVYEMDKRNRRLSSMSLTAALTATTYIQAIVGNVIEWIGSTFVVTMILIANLTSVMVDLDKSTFR